MSLSIKEAILKPSLRAVGQSTQNIEASVEDYNDAFRIYVNMLNFWVNDRNIILYQSIPSQMEELVGTSDPVQVLVDNLILAIADNFAYIPTPDQKSNASRGLRVLKARSGPAYINKQPNQPRGSGNTWRNMCRNNCDSSSKVYVTNTGVQVVTDE